MKSHINRLVCSKKDSEVFATTFKIPGLDLNTIMRAFRDRETALLVINPCDHEPIAVRVDRYDYDNENFLVDAEGQTMILDKNGQDWYLRS